MPKLKGVFGKLFSCVSSRDEKTVEMDSRPGRGVRRTTSPVSVELEPQRAEWTRLEQECRRAKDEANTSAETKRKLEEELQEVKELLEARGKELGCKDASIQRLESELETKLNELREALARVQVLTGRLSEKDKLLSERTTELSAAQAFLTRVDAVSEAEVVGMVENLNTLVSSASGALSATLDQREPIPGSLVNEPDFKQARDYFGDPMFEEVAARNPVAVTLAVEMYLVQFVERVTSGWGDRAAAGALGDIYRMISARESQAIASRWRTLTKRYAPRQEPARGEIVGDLALILMITRTFSDLPEAAESVETNAGTEVGAIIEATLRLDSVIKTKIASSDMSVYVVPPGATFAGTTMVDEFGADGTREEGGEHGIVAGTMEIGLIQRVDNVEKVLRKPKVILGRDLPEPEINA